MVIECCQQMTLESDFVLLDTRQQGVPVILRELVLSDRFDLVSPSLTVAEVTPGQSGHETRFQCLLLDTFNHHPT
ncbi:unnamed protein product [Schistosoma mattheei]|uniref:Uncharacterized protein n=1 Tax=Schistosoma mattheei TaxID=31246 RepID=A0A183NPN4_9TREM|nr:unnamed protein product [Schistosoma mattheei]